MSTKNRTIPPERSGQSPEASPGRRGFLAGGAIAGATALTGFLPGQALAGVKSSSQQGLMAEFKDAAKEYDVPLDLLLAIGYVNTRLEMPPPQASAYRKGDPSGRGAYGIMALERNPVSDTLGEAAKLTGIPVERLKADRAANIRGGAALLAASQGTSRPGDPARWAGAVHGRSGGGRTYRATSGVGGGELYTGQVEDALKRGFSQRTQAGERISLNGRRSN